MNPVRRVVFDTGALVSAALRFSSTSERAFSLAIRSGVICICEPALKRLRSILGRKRLDCYMSTRARIAFVDLLHRHAWICTVLPAAVSAVGPASRDRGSNVILALAVAAEADAIVSIDPGLLARKTWRRIPIITPPEFRSRVDPASISVPGRQIQYNPVDVAW